MINRISKLTIALITALLFSTSAFAASSMSSGNDMMSSNSTMSNPMVGGHAMSPHKNIVQNALNSKNHTTLVAAAKQAGLVKALEGDGPYTVFAPTNAAFNKLPKGTVSTLMKPENKRALENVLLYHVVKGDLTYNELKQRIMNNGGHAKLDTLEGGYLTAMMNGPHNIVIKDARGDVANISTYDVKQSNGVIQVINQVLMPPKGSSAPSM